MTPRRITVVASEILGMPRTGGAGTADSLLAVALGQLGHRVELLVGPGRQFGDLTPEWTRRYDNAGVAVRPVEPTSHITPPFLAPTMAVFHALRGDPPAVVVADDWRGLAFAAMQARRLGIALTETAFVIHCHGPARMLAEFARKVPDTLARFGEEVAERASVELADAVVSPSAWLLNWMRERRWPVPDSARVIQYLRESAALNEPPAQAASGSAVRRVAFFGQLREGKGIRIFLASLEGLEPHVLDGIELAFVGTETRRWTEEQIEASLAPQVTGRVAGIRFETALDRSAALELLRLPGTLAVMPSLLDNSPNTVSECIEHGIPFLAARTGGIPELIADRDRERVLFEPSPEALTAALRLALASPDGFAPAAPAHDPQESLQAWLEVVEAVAPTPLRRAQAATRVAVVATDAQSIRNARRLAERTRSVAVDVVPADSRRAGLQRTAADWVVFLDDEDAPDDDVLDTFVAAQATSDADVVTCAVRTDLAIATTRVFLGSPGALGLAGNHYGVVGMIRRSLLDTPPPEGDDDPDWPLIARLALSGAQIVSIPDALATHRGNLGSVGDVPGQGLAVLRLFEKARGPALADLPQLAATLAAATGRLESPTDVNTPKHIVRRSLDLLNAEGIGGLARRAGGRIHTIVSARRQSK